MKDTKRLLSLILALVLCLSLTACASADDKAFEEADALLAAGDYEGAIAAFSAIGRYQEIAAKIAEAEKLHQEAQRLAILANAEGLFGHWINIKTDFVDKIALTLNNDGTSVLSWGDDVYNSTFDCENNTITVYNPYFAFAIQKVDGVTHLVESDMGLDLVPEANYSAYELQEIAITSDNWQEYFELKEANSITLNAFGEVEYVQPSLGLFLKEEYYSRLPENYWDVDIAFEVTYDETAYKILNCAPADFNYNLIGTYEKEPTTPPSWWELQTGCTSIGQVSDRRNADWVAQESPYYNTFSAEIYVYGGSASDSKTQYTAGWTNIQVSRVIGTLKLFP